MMYPLLVFATGVLAGAAGVRLLKGVKGPLKATGQQATGAVRGAAVSGLSVIERTSASLRTKLEPDAAPTPAPAAPETATPDTAATDTVVTDTAVTDTAVSETTVSETAEPAPRPEGTAP